MSLFLSILFYLLVPVLAVYKQYRPLVLLVLLSLICNLFYFNFFGSRIPLHNYVALCVSPFISPYILRQIFVRKVTFLHYLIFDLFSLIILGIFFGIISPWEPGSFVNWNQNPLGRSLVAIFRLFLDISMAIFIHFCVSAGKVHINTILKMALTIAFIQIAIGLIDLFTNYTIRSTLFTEREIPGRYLGLSHEPRSMARNTAFVLILATAGYIAGKDIYNVKIKHLLLLLFGTLFTASVSSMITIGISAFIFFVVKNKRKRINYLFSFSLILLVSFLIISSTDYYQNNILPKIMMVAYGGSDYGVIDGEPIWLTRFEVMDRAAANFFYKNPKHLWFGTGPNLIGIPSSPYRTESALITLGDVIVAVPGTGLLYTLGRNGILGITLLVLLYHFLNKQVNSNQFMSTMLFFTFIFFIFIHPSWFYFNIGIISSKLKLYDNNHHTST